MKKLKQRIVAKKLEQELQLKDAVVVVDESSCDGCGHCAEICSQSAIHMKTLSEQEIQKLSFKGRLKVRIKGSDKAYINPELCTACGLCMKHCHEFAIHKVKTQASSFGREFVLLPLSTQKSYTSEKSTSISELSPFTNPLNISIVSIIKKNLLRQEP